MYDLAVIGGGPAGMMAAGSAASAGARVLLIEKNDRLGQKLLLTGGGRCNLTNASHDVREMAALFGRNGRFLISPLTRFGPADAVAFFNDLGVATTVEDRGRVFPASDKSRDVLDALTRYMDRHGVAIRTGLAVVAISAKSGRIDRLTLADGSEAVARDYVLATGGLSYPQTGSTGDGHRWLRELGHTVIPPAPALCAVITRGRTAGELEGLSLREVTVALFRDEIKTTDATGDLLFTAEGVSGPAVLDVSRKAGLPGRSEIRIDLVPGTSADELDRKLVAVLSGSGNKRLKSALGRLLPARLASVVSARCGIDGEKAANAVTREERRKIMAELKCFTFEVERLASIDKAMVTSGGVDLREVDSKTMRSKLVENLYFAGEILDLDGPTGGYNLQECWSTGRGVRIEERG